MGFLSALFSEGSLIYWIEVLTILAVLTVLGYLLFIMNVFKKD